MLPRGNSSVLPLHTGHQSIKQVLKIIESFSSPFQQAQFFRQAKLKLNYQIKTNSNQFKFTFSTGTSTL
jgi:hypothetical protein